MTVLSFLSNVTFLAQSAPAASRQSSPLSSLLIMVPLFGIMYFLLIRPQQKKQREQQAMLKTLKAGDKVLTSGGIIGMITRVNERTVRLALTDKVEAEVVRGAIVEIIRDDEKSAETAASTK